jgi:hypothetical protein
VIAQAHVIDNSIVRPGICVAVVEGVFFFNALWLGLNGQA